MTDPHPANMSNPPTSQEGEDAGHEPTIYLGISGVLHPSETAYKLACRRSPWSDGHVPYEGVSVLVDALQDWPDVRLVLTSTQPRSRGIAAVLQCLGASLASRVVGVSYDDITTKVERLRGAARSAVGYSSDDYWRMNKADIVRVHSEWRRPESWIAIDDEDILWSPLVRRDRLVLTDACEGLAGEATKARLRAVMQANFGP